MAERPIFLPANAGSRLVEEVFLPLKWHSGFAAVQKEKNVRELHHSAKAAGYGPLLEVSTKSERTAGRHLSAFHLPVKTSFGTTPLECVFQGSKVFEKGGPFLDLFHKDVREAKRDERLRTSGKLVRFEFEGKSFPLDPKTVFYDWLYIGAIYEHREWLTRLKEYEGFTDIEFNPQRSVNCQARSVALFMTLMKRNLLDEAVSSPECFRQILLKYHYEPTLREDGHAHHPLFTNDPNGHDESTLPKRSESPTSSTSD